MDPTPSKDLIETAQWKAPRIQRRYFLNTIGEDVGGTEVQSVAKVDGIYRRTFAPKLYQSPQLLELSTTDGMLFRYCE